MPVNANKIEDPCQACRDRHLKCDDRRPRCRQCERLNQDCDRSNSKHKFRWGSSAKYDAKFAQDQVWLSQSKSAKLQFVDQGPELENFYSAEDDGTSTFQVQMLETTQPDISDTILQQSPRSESGSPSHASPSLNPSPSRSVDLRVGRPASMSIDSMISSNKSTSASQINSDATTRLTPNEMTQLPSHGGLRDHNRYYVLGDRPGSSTSYVNHTALSPSESPSELRKVYAEYERLEDSAAAEVPPEELLSPAVWKKYFFWPNDWTTTQCVCLMRYYIDNLGPWLDIGDPSRHFTLVVPQRARRCPPLLNAIFTIAAQHLAGLPQYKNKQGHVEYQDHVLPRLDDRQAIKYQNASIAYLKELCKHPDHVQDEDLLAATVILRYFEELESSWGSSGQDSVMRPFQLFVAAQANQNFLVDMNPDLDFSVPGIFTSVKAEAEMYLGGYQHASFRIALRQECARGFMRQQGIGLPLQTWSILQGFDDAGDFVWADRHLYHLAQVIEFCFNDEAHGQWGSARWQELKSFESQWEECKPVSFAAIHHRRPDVRDGGVLPEIWYMSAAIAASWQYFNLSRILLTVYNPTVPRLGPGATLAAKRVAADVRNFVMELCGIASSMPDSEPAMVHAYMAIALCGEHFENRTEQEALLKILNNLKTHHGYPVESTISALRESWGVTSWGVSRLSALPNR